VPQKVLHNILYDTYLGYDQWRVEISSAGQSDAPRLRLAVSLERHGPRARFLRAHDDCHRSPRPIADRSWSLQCNFCRYKHIICKIKPNVIILLYVNDLWDACDICTTSVIGIIGTLFILWNIIIIHNIVIVIQYYGVLLRVEQRILWRRFVNIIYTCVCVCVCVCACLLAAVQCVHLRWVQNII